MADNADDLGELSPAQRATLHQHMQVTSQELDDAIALLGRSEWNIQISIAKFFDGEGPDPVAEARAAQAAQAAPAPSARHENLQESLLAAESRHSTSRRERTDAAPRVVPPPPIIHRTPWLLGLILAPLGWGWRAASTLFRTISYILAFLPASIRPRAVTNRITTGFRSTNGRRLLMPRDAAARFKREFDEEYGPNDLPFFEGV
ncbi:hypothetical protein PT974_01389 [Cladobotryum mycophilum]|uniref:UBX domain-containing protein n=1 Tax=Cladobotryum mycophilum TaxID=491253 RepID=A0ABR0T3H8_9HYPO